MTVFRATSADEINSPVLSDKVRVLKETEEGQKTMCKLFEEERTKAFSEGVIKTIAGMVAKQRISLSQGRLEAEENGFSKEDFDDYLQREYPMYNFSSTIHNS